MGLKVKGTILLDLVKQVRAAKDKAWDQYLESGDWDYINGEVMASRWYPDDFFYRLSLAVFKIIGRSNFDACFAYGQLAARNMAEVYKNMLVQGDPATSIERFIARRKSFFSTDYQDAEKNRVEKGERRVVVHTVPDVSIKNTEVADVLMYSILGTMHEIASLVGGALVQSDIKKKDGLYTITVSWK